MRKLYICEYPYVLYKLLIERLGDTENSYDLILSDSLADLQPMVPVLRQSGLFDRVEFFPSEPYRDYYNLYLFDFPSSTIKKELAILKNHLKMSMYQSKLQKIEFPFDIEFKQYDQIVCTDHPCVINGHLNLNRIDHAVFEHARRRYQMISKQNDWYFCLLNVLDRIHILHGISPAEQYCKEIIVASAEKLPRCIRHKKITVWDAEEHIKNLDEQQKNRLFQIYADAYGLSVDENQTYDLLLTNPLYSDGYLPSEEKQIQFYKDIIRDYFHHPVLIKPHPRDTVDYTKSFPECTVIDPNISSEVLSFGQHLKLSTVLAVYSTSTNTFAAKAEKAIVLEPLGVAPGQAECLKAYQ